MVISWNQYCNILFIHRNIGLSSITFNFEIAKVIALGPFALIFVLGLYIDYGFSCIINLPLFHHRNSNFCRFSRRRGGSDKLLLFAIAFQREKDWHLSLSQLVGKAISLATEKRRPQLMYKINTKIKQRATFDFTFWLNKRVNIW